MCFALWTAGYWADFIDPTTGAAVSNSVFTVPVLYCLNLQSKLTKHILILWMKLTLYWSSCLLGGKSPNTLWCETTHAYKPFGYIVWKIWKNVFSLVTFLEIFPVKLPVNSNSGSSAVKTEDNKQNNIVLIMEFSPLSSTVLCVSIGRNHTANRQWAGTSGLSHRGVELLHSHPPYPQGDSFVCGDYFHQCTCSKCCCC